MPLIEAGFVTADGAADSAQLVALGPTLQVIVGHQPPDGQQQDPENTETVLGLIDTGASESCIDAQLAERLGLPIIDVRTIGGAGGPSEHNVYLAQILIPSLDMPQYGSFTGVNLVDGGQHHQVLLGRTFLRNTIMIYDGFRAQVTVASAKVT